MDNQQKLHLLIGVTGSVATIKLNKLIQLLEPSFQIKIIATKHALHFLKGEGTLKENGPKVYEDQEQWEQWNQRQDPVLHVELRKWAHALLIAPLSANSLAKISNGLSDNLLTLVCRCWNMKKNTNGKLTNPMIVCPAMNTMMWEHPITQKQLKILDDWGCIVTETQEKKLMCGDVGKGAMLSVQEITKIVKESTKQLCQN